jgi:uncharacterized membrane protein
MNKNLMSKETSMKQRRSMWKTLMYLFNALTLAVSVVMAPAPANAQRNGFPEPNGSRSWTGGNHMPQGSKAILQAPNANLETLSRNVRYKVVPIGVLPGKTTTFLANVRAVNDKEHVTGYSYVNTDDYHSLFLTGQGFIWQSGMLKALPLLNGWPGAFGFGINDRDQVVGTANRMDDSGNIIQTAVLWDHGQPKNLGTLEPNSVSFATDVNIWGVSVGGSARLDAAYNTPVVWYGGTIHALPLLPGEDHGRAEEINALGVIVGRQGMGEESQIPCLWYWNGTGYTAVDLGSLGGTDGDAAAINNLGRVVGRSRYAGDMQEVGFLWDSGGLQSLPLLPSDTDSEAYNINDFGQIVGISYLVDDAGNFVSERSVIWENGNVLDLQTLVPSSAPPLTYSLGNINDLGEIAVDGTNPDGTSIGFLLVPTDDRIRARRFPGSLSPAPQNEPAN